jgi:xanthine dehydrogenase accessory factor
VGQALSYFLNRLGYSITLIDNREEFASETMNPHATQRILSDYVEFARQFQPLPNSFAVIMTQGHNYDYDVLKTLYQRQLPLRYIGIIASRAKARGLIRNLQKDFGKATSLENIYTPIGLDIGGDTESEIALSIAAEIQAIRFGRAVPHLRERAREKEGKR